jgi:hypothetical protein
MSVVRLGATKKYSDNWENIFSGGKRPSSTKQAADKPARKSPKKSTKTMKKSGGKKRPAAAKAKRK